MSQTLYSEIIRRLQILTSSLHVKKFGRSPIEFFTCPAILTTLSMENLIAAMKKKGSTHTSSQRSIAVTFPASCHLYRHLIFVLWMAIKNLGTSLKKIYTHSNVIQIWDCSSSPIFPAKKHLNNNLWHIYNRVIDEHMCQWPCNFSKKWFYYTAQIVGTANNSVTLFDG